MQVVFGVITINRHGESEGRRKKLICVMAYVFLTVKLGLLSSLSIAQSGDELAILVPGGGDYSRSIGSD